MDTHRFAGVFCTSGQPDEKKTHSLIQHQPETSKLIEKQGMLLNSWHKTVSQYFAPFVFRD